MSGTSQSNRGRGLAPVAILLLVALFGTLLFGRVMNGGLNHDEHQFLAPGALLARDGLLPYRDYPVFHVPNLTFLYAGIARLTDSYILGTKTFSVGCSVLAIGLILGIGFRWAPRDDPLRFAVPVSVAVLVFLDPLFTHSSGKTWNHDVPATCMVIALISTAANYGRGSWLLALLSGLAIGFAAGARLTSLPLVMPITLAPLVFPGVWKRKIMLMFCAGAGAMIGLAPTIWTASLAPAQFYFDNFRFPRLRLLDPTDIRAQKTVTWWRKGRFFFKKVIVPSWPMFLAYALFGVRSAKIWRQGRNATHFPCALILAVIPFVLAGCFAPSRYQYQHYYAFIPLLALGIAYGAHTAPWKVEWARRLALAIPVLGAILLELTALAKDRYAWVDEIRRPERWFAIRAHATAQRIREHVPSGKVLTLAPAWPIEAGLAIYPEFASGPFAWRSAPHLNIEQRRALHLIGPDDLAGFLAHDPPAAILTGFESSELEKPLRRFATEHGYGVVDLGKDRQLWVRPR